MKVQVDIENADFLERAAPAATQRALVLTKRVMEHFLARTVEQAGNILDRTTHGDGSLAQSLDYEVEPPHGASVTGIVDWGERYGSVLEYGPEVESWMIEAKFAQALRFPILSDTGEVLKVQYVARGYQVEFNWNRSMLRPHVNPAIDALWNEFERMLAEIPGQAVRDVS